MNFLRIFLTRRLVVLKNAVNSFFKAYVRCLTNYVYLIKTLLFFVVEGRDLV